MYNMEKQGGFTKFKKGDEIEMDLNIDSGVFTVTNLMNS